MSIDNYPRPKGELPNRHKSVEQVEADDQMRRDVEEFLKKQKVEQVPGEVSTVAEVLAANYIKEAKRVEEGKKATPNLNKTISHEKQSWGSFK